MKSEIDRPGYHLYGLTYDELLIIDPRRRSCEKSMNKKIMGVRE